MIFQKAPLIQHWWSFFAFIIVKDVYW